MASCEESFHPRVVVFWDCKSYASSPIGKESEISGALASPARALPSPPISCCFVMIMDWSAKRVKMSVRPLRVRLSRSLLRTNRIAMKPQISNEVLDALVLQGHFPEQRVKLV